MIAELVPYADIPNLASQVRPELLEVLKRIQSAHSIRSDLDPKTADLLVELHKLGLVDAGFDVPNGGSPSTWVRNGNGQRVLNYLTGIRSGPHYEIPASELADWLEQQGSDRWWNVDGDPLLTGRMTFPCSAAKLTQELRKIDRPLLVQAKKDDASAKGQTIDKQHLDRVVSRIADSLHAPNGGPLPRWSNDRLFTLCWKQRIQEWLLVEDSQTTEQMRSFEASRLGDMIPRG